MSRLRKIGVDIKPAALEGLLEAAEDTVKMAKATAESVLVRRTGRLFASLQVLDSGIRGDIVFVKFGSTIPGYPYWQEYGWTARGKEKETEVPGKLYFTKAYEIMRPRISSYLLARAQAVLTRS